MAKAVKVMRKGDLYGNDRMAACDAAGNCYERMKVRDPRYGWKWSAWKPRHAMPELDGEKWGWHSAGPYDLSIRLPGREPKIAKAA